MAEAVVTVWIRVRDSISKQVKKIRRRFPVLARTMKAAAWAARRAWMGVSRTFAAIKMQLKRMTMLLAFAAIYGIKKFYSAVITAGAEAERFGMQMVRAFDGIPEAAQNAMDWVRKFAAKTPFYTKDVVKSFIILKNVGIQNLKEVTTALGDTAFMMGRSLEDVTSGFVSLLARVWRRLGVHIDRTGKNAVITAAGIRKVVVNNLTSVRKALIEVLVHRFGGAMKMAERTWTGMVALFWSEWW